MKEIKVNIVLIVYTKIFLLTDVKNNNTACLSYTNCSLNTEYG